MTLIELKRILCLLRFQRDTESNFEHVSGCRMQDKLTEPLHKAVEFFLVDSLGKELADMVEEWVCGETIKVMIQDGVWIEPKTVDEMAKLVIELKCRNNNEREKK